MSTPLKMENLAGASKKEGLRVAFDRRVKLEFHGSQVTSDAGLLAYRELDEALWLTNSAAELLHDWRSGELFPRIGFIVTNLTRPAKAVVRFYNQRGTAEQWIKEGKNAVKWTRLSCHDFVDNQVRLQLFALAYNLGNFLRRLALPVGVKHWSMTTLREKLIKIGAKVVYHARSVVFQMAEVAVPREVFRLILARIRRLGPPAVASG